MATLITQLDRQTGNYEQVFIYTINASFNGIAGNIDSAQIKVFIPDYLNLFLGDVQQPVKSVSEVPVENGREVIYDFGAITDLGIAVRLGFGVSFTTDVGSGQTFLCSPKMIINQSEVISSQSELITLVLTPQFEISRQLVLPVAQPSPGSAVFYKLTLQNFGDLGAVINNVVITCNGSDILTLDTTYPVNGLDVSTKFADKSADDTPATFVDGSLVFELASYKGEKYEFIYRALVDDSLQIGSEVATMATWSIDGVPQDTELHEITLSDKIYDADITLYAPDYSLPDEYICYRMGLRNTGNQILLGALFENDLPQEATYYRFDTGSFHIGAIRQDLSAEYFVDYESINGLTGRLGPFNTDNNTTVDISTFIPQGDNLSKLSWELETLGIGVQNKASPQILGIVSPEVGIDSSVVNHIHLTFDEGGLSEERVQNTTTLIANYCTLRPSISSSVASTPIRPNDDIEFTFGVNCRNSRLNNPILAFLMPKELEYVGNESYSYGDIFGAISPQNPPVQLIPNFNAEGDTLVKFEFRDEYAFSFRQLASISIKFDARVAVGALGSIDSFLLLSTQGSVGVIPGSVDIYVDNSNIAQDPQISKNYAKSGTLTNRILYFVSTSSGKKVKGLLDSEYMEEPAVGKTVSGGSLEYLITVKNIGNADLDEVEIVDILPYVGDTGVIETSSPRNSAYPIYAISEVVAVIVPQQTTADFDIFYSQSTDPLRFGPNFNIIGTQDDWSPELPEDLSLLRAFKVKTRDVTLSPGQTLKVAVTAVVPVGVELSQVAWNSFAADVVYTDLSGEKQHLLAIEPEKVGLTVAANEEGRVKISGYSWVDDNGDGLYTEEESFVNDVLAVLYSEEGQQLRISSTRSDAQGRDGRYAFENLEPGRYYVKFFIDDDKLKFTRQNTEAQNGSRAAKSGLTPLLDLTLTDEISDVNVGILSKDKHTLDEIMKINGQARGVLRDVIKSQMLLGMKHEDVLEILQQG